MLTTTPKTWEEAQAEAQQYGGNLVTINDAAEEQWLKSTFGTDRYLWIGLTDKDSEGNFVWVNGEPVSYTNWSPNQPDNWNNEDYVHLSFGGKWNDLPAYWQTYGIIEVPSAQGQLTLTRTGSISSALTVNYTVSGTATNGTDYTNLGGTVTFAAGSSTATINISPLPDSVLEDNETITVTLTPNNAYQLGTTTTANLAIIDNTTYPTQGYLKFDGVDDQFVIADQDAIDFDTNQNFTVEVWFKADPTQEGGNSILEKWWSGNGPEGYPFVIRYMPDSGIVYVRRYDIWNNPGIDSSIKVNDNQWHHLAFVKNGQILRLYIDGVEDPNSGVTDTTVNTTKNPSPIYVGSRGPNSDYFAGGIDDLRIWNVARTQAEIQANYKRELQGNESGLVGYWKLNGTANDWTSNQNHGSLRNNPTWQSDRLNTVTISANSAYVGESYYEYNGHKYLLTSSAKTWEQAQQEAQQYGGNLVTINSAAEEQWIQSTFGTSESFWIGLTDKASEGNFVWINGEPVTYTNWHPNEPNDAGGNEDYTHMNVAGKWNDHNSSAVFRGLIEIPSTPGQFTITRTGDLANSLTVNYSVAGTATNGTDYSALNGIATFAAGSATALVNINPIDDPVYELNETVTLTLTSTNTYNITNANSATITISDNDELPIVTINANDPNAAEPSDGGQFTLNRTGSVANALTVYYSIGGSATNGTDYSGLSGNITFAAGSSTAIINVSTIDDLHYDGNESVVLTLASNSNYTVGSANSATVTITDNDTSYLIYVNNLVSNQEYYKGWSITTANGYKLIFQTDGNLVNYNPSGSPLWATGTYAYAENLVFQLDGNLVLYNTSGKAIWATNTDGYRGKIFAFQDDGNLVIYDDNYHPLFARTPGVFNAASLWQNPSSPPNPSYVYQNSDYLKTLYRDNVGNVMTQNADAHEGPVDSVDGESDRRVFALTGGEVIEAYNGRVVRSSTYTPQFGDWIYNGTIAIYNSQLNKTFIYWHFAEGSINTSLKGTTISAGTQIGIEGNTGYALGLTGIHTHVQVHEGRVNVDMSRRIAPPSSSCLYLPSIFQEGVRLGQVDLFA